MKSVENTNYIFDIIRKKFVVLTPEENVRQHLLWYLIHEKKYSASLIAVEKGLRLHGMKKRFDLLVFDRSGKPRLLAECKAPEVKLTQKVFEQIANYNRKFRVRALLVTNGIQHLMCVYSEDFATYEFVNEIPGEGAKGEIAGIKNY
ncbi:MAG: type I restriction enzyme HsdR N-terminal domain-containing protein [Bacteroidia bacterium]